MITFEEFQFKIKHNQINSVNNGKDIADLKNGDWFYGINNEFYEHCQIVAIKHEKYQRGELLALYFNNDNSECRWSSGPDANILDNGYTMTNKYNEWCITTLPDVAEEWHKKLCPGTELKEYPAK